MQITGNGVLFTNFSNEDFTWTFAGEPFTFKARESTLISLGSKEHNEGIARLFCKHLVDREMDKEKLPTNHFSRHEFEKKCYIEFVPEPIVTTPAKELSNQLGVEATRISTPETVEEVMDAPKKRGRPAKAKEEFAQSSS